MGKDPKITTTVSTKGQVILPKVIRSKRRWEAGTKLLVEETADGVLLKSAPLFKPTQMKDVYGAANYKGPPVSIEDMDKAVEAEFRRRYARGRH